MKKAFISLVAVLLFLTNSFAFNEGNHISDQELETLIMENLDKSKSELCDGRPDRQLSFHRNVQLRSSNDFTLINWNAHKLDDPKFITDLAKLSTDADIITIQESMHSGLFENQFLSNFEFEFSFNMSFCNKDKVATGVMNMSRYRINSNQTLVSPDTEPITNTPKVSGYSAIDIPHIGIVHVINIHALNFNLGSKFERHVNSVAAFIKTLNGPVIWTGDFNTWSSGRQKHLDKVASSLGLAHVKLANDKRNLKLDHVYVRGLDVVSAELLNGYKSSDHLPVKVILRGR
jgi:endonuclease/exonuclease/phosphatase (EEP) superfamily protein YafD